MNNIDILINNKKYNENYVFVKSQYKSLINEISEMISNEYIIEDELFDYYRKISVYYEEYRELILNNYHYDFIRNGNSMNILNSFTKHIAAVEEAMTYMLDINTEGECKL